MGTVALAAEEVLDAFDEVFEAHGDLPAGELAGLEPLRSALELAYEDIWLLPRGYLDDLHPLDYVQNLAMSFAKFQSQDDSEEPED